MSRFTCPVCGFPDLDEPAHDSTGAASFDICPCCFIQFGYEDAGTSHAELRADWIAAGKPWRGASPKPPGWDADEQLRRAGLV